MKEVICGFLLTFFDTLGIVMAVFCGIGAFCCLFTEDLFGIIMCGIGICVGVSLVYSLEPHLPRR